MVRQIISYLHGCLSVMINKISIENYKSFKSASFEFPSLTFFVGANSCGKSSVSNLLLLLSQSLDSSFDFETILRFNGKNIGLGDDINIIRDHKEDNKVSISWSIDNKVDSFEKLTESKILWEYYHAFRVSISTMRESYLEEDDPLQLEINKLELDAESVVYNRFLQKDSKKLLRIFQRHQSILGKMIESISISDNEISSLYVYQIARLKDLLKFINKRNFEDMEPKSLMLVLRFNSKTGEAELEQHSIKNKAGDEIIGFKFATTKRIDIQSDIIDAALLKKSRRDIAKSINRNSILLTKEPADYRGLSSHINPFASYCLMYLRGATSVLCEQFIQDKIYHVSPLRALPQRYYLLEKSANHKVINSYSGNEVIEVLKNNPKILSKINLFFKEFNISIAPVKERDVIHRITIKQNDLSVDLTDVGFGISQVLPILVQLFLCESSSTIIIEQPEIHLHPNMQAILTTLLAKIAIEQEKKLIIETHSEAMLRRLQLLYLDPEFELTNDDVRVYQFTRNSDGTSTAHSDTLGPLGDIKWIKGFKDVEIQDTLKIQALRTEKLTRAKNSE